MDNKNKDELNNKLIDLLTETLENNTKINKRTLEIVNAINKRNNIKDTILVLSLLSFFLMVYLFWNWKVGYTNDTKNKKDDE